jgi:S-adenosylmethionine:tRNA-ribosyltransferase-isomerase (queuine synthetase)
VRAARRQSPARDRSRARGTIAHRHFTDIVEYVAPGDTLFVNATRVFRARLLCTRDSGAPAEVFLLRPLEGDTVWEAMVQPGSKVRPGRRVHVAPGFDVEILETTPRHTRVVRLATDASMHASVARGDRAVRPRAAAALHHAQPDTPGDAARYQTVYARTPGSVAAPTAGLHFTPALLDRLTAKGVERAEVLLHVGAGTFRPIQDDDPSRTHARGVVRSQRDGRPAARGHPRARRTVWAWAPPPCARSKAPWMPRRRARRCAGNEPVHSPAAAAARRGPADHQLPSAAQHAAHAGGGRRL